MRRFIGVVAMLSTASAPGITAAQVAAPATAPAAAAPLDAKAAKQAAKAEEKRQRELKAKYGEGPYPDQIDAYVAAKPEPLRPLYRTLYTGGERNAVLNFERLGLAAFEAGEYAASAWAFDQALARIEAVYADNPQAATARSIFHNEANKDFKGEPYERAMAYYYRGLLYLRDGDFGNARASFKSAEYQDTLSDAETFQSDFAVMNYLIGWTQQCEGRAATARESFALATKAQPGLAAPAAGDNVLFVSELGNGPVKARDGNSAQKLVFRGGAAYPETGAMVEFVGSAGDVSRAVQPNSIRLVQASSVNYQATTRGGRAIDGLMNGKANWKEGTGTAGSVAMQAAQSSLLNNQAGMGMGMMGLGLALSLFSSAMKTKADIRGWDGLPDLILIGTAHADTPAWTYKVGYTRKDEPFDMKGEQMRATPKGCSVVWTRSRPTSYQQTIAGEDDGVAAAQNRKKPVIEKNRLFRASLESAKQ